MINWHKRRGKEACKKRETDQSPFLSLSLSKIKGERQTFFCGKWQLLITTHSSFFYPSGSLFLSLLGTIVLQVHINTIEKFNFHLPEPTWRHYGFVFVASNFVPKLTFFVDCHGQKRFETTKFGGKSWKIVISSLSAHVFQSGAGTWPCN